MLVVLLAFLPLAAMQGLARSLDRDNTNGPGTAPAGNLPPVALGNTFVITEDWSISVGAPGLLAGDFDPDGDPISVTEITTPTHGTIFFSNPDGSFGYQPHLDFNGVDTFQYTISDGVLTDTAVVTMTIPAVNDVPLATDDVFTTTQDIPLHILAPGVLANDTDAELDPFSAYLFAPPFTGTLTLNSNGSFDYVPPFGYTGVVTFVYAASDALGTAVEFDGVDSYIDLGDSYENLGDLTVEAWVYRAFATGAFEEIFSKDVINSFAIDDQGHLHFNLGDGSVWGVGMSSVAPIPLNQWVHVAATWDSATGEAKLYINGQWDSTSTLNLVVGNNAAVRGIGQKPAFDTSTFPGMIDEVRVWNTVLDEVTFWELMWGSLTGMEPGLIGYYKLDEGAGLIAADSVGGLDGTLTDFTPSEEWVRSPHPFSNPAVATLHILPGSVSPDLSVPNLIATPAEVCQGEFFSVLFSIANQGGVDAGKHQVYLYNDETPSDFTNRVFTANISGVSAGQTRYFGLSVNSFLTGTRYLKAFADGGAVITETNEANNSAVIPLTVQPDPAPTGTILINGGASSAVLPNLTLTLSATDAGPCATSAADMRFAYEGLTTPWEPYTSTKEIIVFGPGEVQVAVQFRDEHNNVSAWFEAVITLGELKKMYMPIILR